MLSTCAICTPFKSTELVLGDSLVMQLAAGAQVESDFFIRVISLTRLTGSVKHVKGVIVNK